MTIDAIIPFSLWHDIKNYRLSFFYRDLVAAISVALLALPQSMAYAFVADLPASAGIFAAIFGTIFTASFGASRFLVSGPTTTIAILLQSGVSEILYTYYRGVSGDEKELLALKIVLQIVLIIGLFQIIAGLLKMGRLTRFTSRSVIVGYTAGVAVVVLITQLYPFLGILEMSGYHSLYQQAWNLISHLHLIHFTTFFIALSCLILLIVFYRISKKIPGAAIVFLLAGGFVALFNLFPSNVREGVAIEKVALLEEIGPIYSNLPQIANPFFEWRIMSNVIPLAFAITLLSVLEATAIGRSYTSAKDPPYADNQEIYGLGISNFLSSFLGAMPSSGSFSRSALNYTSGAKTRLSAVISGLVGLGLIVTIGFFIAKIPLAALSALMLFTAYTMVDFKDLFLCLKATRGDAFVVGATLLSSFLFSLDVALYIGIVLSIVLYLRQAAIPYLIEYSFNNVGKLRPLDPEEERPDSRICIIQPEGELFFGAADLLQTKLREISEDENIKIIILQLFNTRHIDASVCLALRQVFYFLKMTKRRLLIAGISSEIWDILEEAGLIQEIGEENIFSANEQLPSEPTRSAYAYAKTILTTT